MTPKEKAEKLFYDMSYNSFDEDHHCSHYVAVNCALIAVEEILSEFMFDDSDYANRRYKYYQEVKKELEEMK